MTDLPRLDATLGRPRLTFIDEYGQARTVDVSVPGPGALAPTADPRGPLAGNPMMWDEAVATVNADLRGWQVVDQSWPTTEIGAAGRALDWARYRWTPEQMSAWNAAGVYRTLDAGRWVAAGGTPQDAAAVRTPEGLLFVQAGNLPCERPWGALRDVCTPSFAAVGHEQRQSVQAIRALAEAMAERDGAETSPYEELRRGGVQAKLPWSQWASSVRTRMARFLFEGLAWEDVAVCLRAGMSGQEAAEFLKGGGDVEAARTMGGLRDG